ncbi:MAG: sigma-E processing peptidase SpoIIGA [Eubacteriales bacterium]
MVVYGDLLFLINFSMDFLCFYICCRLLHEKLPTFRGVLASFLGGVYSVASLFIKADRWIALSLDLFVLCVMCLCVWGRRKMTLLRFFKNCGIYFFVSALLGGLMTALFSLFNQIGIFAEDIGLDDGIEVWIFAVLALVSCIFTLFGGRFFRSSSAKGTLTLVIESERGSATLTALIDSGNGAVEPISGKSVVFVSLDALAGVLTGEEYSAFSEYSATREIPVALATRVRLVPVKTVNGSALLPAVKFKKVSIIMKGKVKEIDVYIVPLPAGLLVGHEALMSHETTVL